MPLYAQEHRMTLGVSAWFGLILDLVLTMVNWHCVWCSINCCGDMVRSTLVSVDGGLGSMRHRPSLAYDFKVIRKCPM